MKGREGERRGNIAATGNYSVCLLIKHFQVMYPVVRSKNKRATFCERADRRGGRERVVWHFDTQLTMATDSPWYVVVMLRGK